MPLACLPTDCLEHECNGWSCNSLDCVHEVSLLIRATPGGPESLVPGLDCLPLDFFHMRERKQNEAPLPYLRCMIFFFFVAKPNSDR